MDLKYMKLALRYATEAYKKNEVPVGAVIVKDGNVISYAFNKKECNQSVLEHAELIAIRKAEKKLNNWRLNGCDIYVTLDPCPMCAGAIINARINKVIYGAKDSEMGAVSSVISMFDLDFCHRPKVVSGVLEEECSKILKDFFKKLR